MKVRVQNTDVECERCAGKGLGGAAYDNRPPDYASPTIEYGELRITDYRGDVTTVHRDTTAEDAIAHFEEERERLHAAVDLRIEAHIAAVRTWDGGKPYPQRRFSSESINAPVEAWKLTKAHQCAEFLRPLLADWQYSKDILELTRFRGHLNLWDGRRPDGKSIKTAVSG